MLTNLQVTVDDLGEVKAKIATLKLKETELKDVLIDAGVGSYDGSLFKATVYNSSRDNLDKDALVARLEKFYGDTPKGKKAFAEFIRSHTETNTFPNVKVSARNGK